jgi:hypothetical protein
VNNEKSVSDCAFRNGALAKAKTIMRNKIQALMEGREPVDEDYTKIAVKSLQTGELRIIARTSVARLISFGDAVWGSSVKDSGVDGGAGAG